MRSTICALVLLVATNLALAVEPAHDDAKLLTQNGIQATREGTAKYLRKLKPDAVLQAKAESLVKQLDSPEFAVREAAMNALLELPIVPLDLLREAESSPDLEIAFRAKKILNHPRTEEKRRALLHRQEVVAAVLRTVRDMPIKDATSVVLEVAPFLDSWALTLLAADVVATIAGPGDIELLRRSIASENVATRVVAIRGLGNAAGRPIQDELRKLCDDPEPRVVLAAGHALAAQGDRTALPPLVRLLADDDTRIRARSIQLLRALTNRQFGLNPFAKTEEQKAQQERWETWLAKESLTAPLHVPLKLKPLFEDLGRGLLLHYTFDGGMGRELKDSSGHGRHGTLHNASEFARRGGREVLAVAGQGHHGDLGGHATIPFIDFAKHDQFTLALWVKESGMSHPEGEAYITFGTDRGVGIEDSLGIAHLNSDLLFRVGAGQVSVPYDVAYRGRWVHYAMTFESGRLRAYCDGKLIGETAARVGVVSKRAGMGRHWWGDDGIGTSTRFQGALDDVRVYDRALPSQQIQMLAKRPK
jgi:HEAT repeat protein